MVEPYKLFGRLGNQMFQMAYILGKHFKGEIDDYFVQDPKHFDECGHYVKKMFGDDIYPIDKVAIHVRRGDYVGNQFYVDLALSDYYQKAISYFPHGTKFMVFSDDIEYCKLYFYNEKNHTFLFSEETDPVKSLNFMAGCKHQIIANSSFSWWAAYLNPNPNKIVIAPKAWYSDGVERTKCPESWLRM